MIEVEVKAKINSFEEMESRLASIGTVKSKKEFQEDIYFASPIVDFAKTDEALRIRTTNNNTFITYKGPKLNSEAKTRKEVEMTIESAEKAKDIFEEIGFREARTVRKNRQYYTYENFEISLDDVEDARYVAHKLGFEHYVYNFGDRFKECVIDRFNNAYMNGETPNPCIDCNRFIKFNALLKIMTR